MDIQLQPSGSTPGMTHLRWKDRGTSEWETIRLTALKGEERQSDVGYMGMEVQLQMSYFTPRMIDLE